MCRAQCHITFPHTDATAYRQTSCTLRMLQRVVEWGHTGVQFRRQPRALVVGIVRDQKTNASRKTFSHEFLMFVSFRVVYTSYFRTIIFQPATREHATRGQISGLFFAETSNKRSLDITFQKLSLTRSTREPRTATK